MRPGRSGGQPVMPPPVAQSQSWSRKQVLTVHQNLYRKCVCGLLSPKLVRKKKKNDIVLFSCDKKKKKSDDAFDLILLLVKFFIYKSVWKWTMTSSSFSSIWYALSEVKIWDWKIYFMYKYVLCKIHPKLAHLYILISLNYLLYFHGFFSLAKVPRLIINKEWQKMSH